MSVMCVIGEWEERGAERSARELLTVVPRVAVEEGGARVWADVRGLRAEPIARAALERLTEAGTSAVRAGVAKTPVAAYAAAFGAAVDGVQLVAAGTDRAFLAPLPLDVLEPDTRLAALLDGVGIENCGMLAELEQEAVEVRFGVDALIVWRRARAQDDRRLFRDSLRELPQASLDFIDYVVTDPERLLFTTNALLGGLCETLRERGLHARRIALMLPLANGDVWRKMLSPARPTASRSVWLRLVRGVLERLSVPDAVAGVRLEVMSTEAAAAVQGDLFDAGFATASAVESALARLLEAHGPVIVRPEPGAHPLAERRAQFAEIETEELFTGDNARLFAGEPADSTDGPGVVAATAVDGLTLQLLPEPCPIRIETRERRDHTVPVRYHNGEWISLTTVAGPDRISGGQWDTPYAREYFRCLSREGQLLWLYRDARDDQWYVHGWWD